MNGLLAVYRRELWLLRRKLPKQVSSMAVAPLLYLVAFGYAMGQGTTIGEHSYLEFLLPGLVAMASMTQAFAMAGEINIARFYWHIFEEFQASPLSAVAYVGGEVLAGITRALIGVVVIILLGMVFGVRLHIGPLFWLAVVLNALVFGSLAVAMAMLVRAHADQLLVTNFVITPMAFLGGTFFPLERLPELVQLLLKLLPITHAAMALRAAALGQSVPLGSLLQLLILGLGCFILATRCVTLARD